MAGGAYWEERHERLDELLGGLRDQDAPPDDHET